MEEAGIIGQVGETPLGRYSFHKWGSLCNVVVYPMEVTRVFPHGEWEENHRERRWVSPADAIEHLKADGLKTIVRDFAAHMP